MPPKCDHSRFGDTADRCVICRAMLVASAGAGQPRPAKFARTTKVNHGVVRPCPHRGEVVRRDKCAAGGGCGTVEVSRCALPQYGECTTHARRSVVGVKRCASCKECPPEE